jgi:NAD(P)-dependent dehydrogenase (short-subunit alcohol dehydrogenase family)
MQACHPHLKASGAGRIINFASLAGQPPYRPYNMGQGGGPRPTRVAAREWGADKITVNNVLPVADTWGQDDVPPAANALGRHGLTEADVAPVVLSSRARTPSS